MPPTSTLPLRHRARLCGLAALVLAPALRAADPGSPPPAPAREPSRLSPLANPRLEMTVITEMTEAGRARPLVTPQAPAYFVLHSGGYITRGETPVERNLTAPEVERLLVRHLAANGFLPATDLQGPSLLLVYYWGTHNPIVADPELASRDVQLRNIYDRAALAGGDKFAAELIRAAQSSIMAGSASARVLGRAPDQETVEMGAAAGLAMMSGVMDPVRLFAQRSAKHEFLVNQATSDCYYLVVSAFDYASVGTGQRQLLWRTRLTVAAHGTSQPESFPTLVASAARFFGRDMPEAEIVRKPALRAGQVEIGTPTVVEPAPPASGR